MGQIGYGTVHILRWPKVSWSWMGWSPKSPHLSNILRLAWGKVHCGGSSHWASCEPSHIAVEHRHRCWGHHLIISSRYECWVLMAFFTKETTFLSSISLRVKTLRGLVFTFVVGEPVGVTFSTGLWMSFLSCNDNLCTSMYKRFPFLRVILAYNGFRGCVKFSEIPWSMLFEIKPIKRILGWFGFHVSSLS